MSFERDDDRADRDAWLGRLLRDSVPERELPLGTEIVRRVRARQRRGDRPRWTWALAAAPVIAAGLAVALLPGRPDRVALTTPPHVQPPDPPVMLVVNDDAWSGRQVLLTPLPEENSSD